MIHCVGFQCNNKFRDTVKVSCQVSGNSNVGVKKKKLQNRINLSFYPFLDEMTACSIQDDVTRVSNRKTLGFVFSSLDGIYTKQERERSGERKSLVAGDANLTIMLR